MPLDGIALAGIAHELNNAVGGGRVEKIAQPETDEVTLAFRARGAYKLLLSANASSPRAHLTQASKTSPQQAPMFCMVLRKHLSGGRLLEVKQPDFERILEFHIDSLNEMGDRAVKRLIIEIMGKHSNIILVNENGIILDSIKRVSHDISAVREVLPGKAYERPPSGGKISPIGVTPEIFNGIIAREDKKSLKLQQAVYQSFNGISPVLASEICERAGINASDFAGTLNAEARARLFKAFNTLFRDVEKAAFDCRVYIKEKGKTADFSVLPLTLYSNCEEKTYPSPSQTLEAFYRNRDADYRVSQKTADLRKLIDGHIARCVKKRLVYDKTLEEIKDRDRFKMYGELITAYIYKVEKGAESFTAEDFNDNNARVEIPLDALLTPAENAQKYFKQYNKQKRAFTALQEQMRQNDEDIRYLDSVLAGLQTTEDERDISEVRAELISQGFLKKPRAGGREGHNTKNKKSAKSAPSKPLRYVSTDGYEMYVGKNNIQNDELTLRFAQSTDIWLHTKDIAGSHVIIKTRYNAPTPESTLNEAANLAAYYSKARGSAQVPVDYVIRKHVRKPNGAKPGFVIYDHHKTAYITPREPSPPGQG